MNLRWRKYSLKLRRCGLLEDEPEPSAFKNTEILAHFILRRSNTLYI